MFILEVAEAFNQNKIKYAVVGGYAVVLHGIARATYDLDIIINITESDFIEVEKILNHLGLQSRIPVTGKEVFHFRKEYIERRNLIAWSFCDPVKPMRVVDVIITEDCSALKVTKLKVKGIEVSVLSKESLIDMKKRSGRPQDIEDIKALESIL